MSEITLKFTPEQYKSLLKLIYIGDWVANAHRADERITSFEEIEKIVYSNATHDSLKDLVIVDEDGAFPSRELEEDDEVQEIIEEYDAQTMWTELINLLATRIGTERFGKENIENEGATASFFTYSLIEDLLGEEFAKNGLDNLKLEASFDLPNLEEIVAAAKQAEEELEPLLSN